MSGKSHTTLRPCAKCKRPTRSLYKVCAGCVERELPAMEKKVWRAMELSREWLSRPIARNEITQPANAKTG